MSPRSLARALRHRRRIRRVLTTPAGPLSGQHAPARYEVHRGVGVLHLYGTAEAMGVQYGLLLGPALRALVGYAGVLLPAPLREGFCRYASDRSQHLPDAYRHQVAALSEAAKVPLPEMLAMNVVPRIRCSTLATWGPATPDGELIMGRNADYFGLGLADRGSLLMVLHPDEGRPVVLVSFIGMVGGFTGMNDVGVSFGNMLVLNAARRRWRDDGLPVQLAMRQVATQAGSARQFVEGLAELPHAVPNNVMVADEGEALVAELGTRSAELRQGRAGWLASTNDFRVHPDAGKLAGCPRFDLLARLAEQHAGQMDLQRMRRALLGAHIPRRNLQAAIMVPARRHLHVSLNRVPAAGGPYRLFSVRRLTES